MQWWRWTVTGAGTTQIAVGKLTVFIFEGETLRVQPPRHGGWHCHPRTRLRRLDRCEKQGPARLVQLTGKARKGMQAT